MTDTEEDELSYHTEQEEWVGYPITVCGYCMTPWPCDTIKESEMYHPERVYVIGRIVKIGQSHFNLRAGFGTIVIKYDNFMNSIFYDVKVALPEHQMYLIDAKNLLFVDE